ncbi:MAG TPA: class I SAM-dependent methyltransferase, partial [Gemmataceae bacterium]|nr:class I SAM-dependent methyltransferase [Gemmataceae bacterium]
MGYYEMDRLIQDHVKHPVKSDTRTIKIEGEPFWLGYPMETIRKMVLGLGLADFANSCSHPLYGALSADDRVLLYCFINMKRHLANLSKVMTEYRQPVNSVLSSPHATVIDIGCGPGTAFLAIASVLEGSRFRYYGIDSAAPMRSKADSLWQAAMASNLIGEGSTAVFTSSWDQIPANALTADSQVLLVFSCFFGSPSLTNAAIQSLCGAVTARLSPPHVAKTLTVYLNSSVPLATA